ncbi:MAG: FecR domain-containing protein, partial [Limnobacter sp.]|nr:FecR domain-containing protein [Limnobacter sp.]
MNSACVRHQGNLSPQYGSVWLCLVYLLLWALSGSAWAQNQAPTALKAVAEQPTEAKQVGTIRNFTGLVNLQSADGKNRFANVGTHLLVGDIINTQKNSTAMLEFVDNTQVALRPSTQFVVEDFEYQPENPIADRADFKLVKGGLRTLTGLIGKRSTNDAFQMRSETATIGIRGTDFSARVCKGDECKRLAAGESESTATTNASTVGAAGRVSQVLGQFTSISQTGEVRQLTRGDAVFPGDKVKVDESGFAVLVMADSSRMTLPSGSELEISAFQYVPSSPKTSVASFKLLTGAVRAVTGAIGKAQPENVTFASETATIGIRGTEINFGIVPPG